MGNTWSQRTDWETVCKRAAGRKRINAIRTLLRKLREAEMLRLLTELGWVYGSQAEVARRLNVHPSVISKGLKRVLPLVTPCPHCGQFRPRRWWKD